MKRKATQMACSGAMQGTAGADGGHKPQADVEILIEDALLIEHFYNSASESSGGSNESSPSAGMIRSSAAQSCRALCTFWQIRALSCMSS